MQIYLVDDDPAVLHVLTLIIQGGDRGEIAGSALCAVDALEDLRRLRPDIVLVDLLMPGMDGIAFVREARTRYPRLHFVMLSQVSSKDMVAEAYAAGVDFFISKPVNGVEVASVVQKMGDLIAMDRTMRRLRTLLRDDGESAPAADKPQPTALNGILNRIGISGDPACREIVQVVEYLASCGSEAEQTTVAQCCARFCASPKAMEQRIRRAATAGMVNLANMGIEDYANDVFTEFAGTLYHFEQVRREMDCIRGKSAAHGRVSVKKFLYALAALCGGH